MLFNNNNEFSLEFVLFHELLLQYILSANRRLLDHDVLDILLWVNLVGARPRNG